MFYEKFISLFLTFALVSILSRKYLFKVLFDHSIIYGQRGCDILLDTLYLKTYSYVISYKKSCKSVDKLLTTFKLCTDK